MIVNKKRIQIFDIAKGISIILMTISRYDFATIYPELIYFQSIATFFKMPTFIFISGYLLSKSLNLKSFFYHKIDALLKPLISFTVSLTFLNIILYVLVSDEVTLKGAFDIITNLVRSFYHGSFDTINVSFWFIGGLFLGQLSLRLFLTVIDLKKPLSFLSLFAFFILLMTLHTLQIKFYWTEYIPVFFTYLFLGYSFKILCARYFDGSAFFYQKSMIIFPILFATSFLAMKSLRYTIDFNIAALHFNYHYLLIISLLGVFSLLFVCRFIEKIPIISSLLVFCSRASFFILAYHIFIKDIFLLFFDIKSYNPLLQTFLFFLNITLCCFIFLFLKRVPIIRLFFYPMRSIVVNEKERKILESKYVVGYLST